MVLLVAQNAVEKSGGKDAAILDTLALAYFLTGDAAKAIETTEEKALSLLPPDDSALRKALEKSLARFRGAKSQPTTQPTTSPGSKP